MILASLRCRCCGSHSEDFVHYDGPYGHCVTCGGERSKEFSPSNVRIPSTFRASFMNLDDGADEYYANNPDIQAGLKDGRYRPMKKSDMG